MSSKEQRVTNTIVATVPLGVGIALNPIAIVISILVVSASNHRRNGVALVLGWVLGLGILVAAPALLIQLRFPIPNGAHASLQENFALFRAALGIMLLIAAALAFVKGPLPGDQPADPRWTRILEKGGAGRTFGLGIFLSTVNLRNLLLLAAAASVIGQANLGVPGALVTVAVFVALSTLGILAPLLAHLWGGAASEDWLNASANWLTRHMGMITGVIMALFGVLLLTEGLQGVR